jgi:cation:H+ antiporter
LVTLAFIGILILISGSYLTVTSGKKIAQAIGVSDTVIALTLIALGTSLPELATTIVGVFRNETDIVVGNIIGSNIFNLLFIGGVVPIIRPIPIDRELFSMEFPVLLFLSILVLPLMRTKWYIHRIEGLFLLLSYIIFIGLTFYK